MGESLRDVFYMIDEATVSCSINKDSCLLCLAYAEKIPVKQVIKVPAAGNSANAAVAAKRLGLKSALVSWIGQDIEGQLLKKELKKQGVDVTYLCDGTGQDTSEATIMSYKGEKTQLVSFKKRKYLVRDWPKARCLYYSAMGENYGAVDSAIFKYLKKFPDTAFVFQPGTTYVRNGLERMKRLVAACDVLVLNKTEAIQILKQDTNEIRVLLETLHGLGAGFVIITDGKNGADAYNGLAHWHMPVFPDTALESTGAGDAFASGVACALIYGHEIPTALRWGTANSWSVIQHIGPQEGLLTQKGLNTILEKFKRIAPQEMPE